MRKLPILLNALLTTAIASGLTLPALGQGSNVYTYHYNNQRTGANLNETVLTPANVNQNSFGKLFAHKVDGAIYAQPLYVANVPVAGVGTRNVVYCATEHGSVYAWDADTTGGANGHPLWQISVLDPTHGVSSIAGDINQAEVLQEVCITGTPVIDPSTNALYFVAQTYEVTGSVGTYVQRLHAVDIRSGAEIAPFPVVIQGSVPGTERNPGQTVTPFISQRELQRAGLTLVNGVIYIAWCGITEDGRHGWLMGYNALGTPNAGQQRSIFCTSPNANLGGIWGSGNGVEADTLGNVYTVTGNGTFDGNNINGADWSQCVLRLSTIGGLTVTDYFAPFNNGALSSIDSDFGSGGLLLLPDAVGSAQHPHLLLACGKEGRIYLLDRDNLGQFSPTGDNVVQEMLGVINGVFGSPVYWNDGTTGYVYYSGKRDYLKEFTIANGLMSSAPVAAAPDLFGWPGSVPSVSANGTHGGIVWTLQDDGYKGGSQSILRAYNALDVSQELYDSTQAGSRDTASPAVKFTTPIVANGKVYIGTKTSLGVYGLLPGAPPTVVTPAAATPSTTATKTTALSITGGDTAAHGGENSLTYTWSATGTPPGSVSFSANGTNAAKSATVTFGALGVYNLLCTITSGTQQTVTSAVTVTVIQGAATTTVLPSGVSVYPNGTQQFKATGVDQFGTAIPSTAAWKWYLDAGSVGAVSKTGLYTAGAGSGNATVRAKFNTDGGTAGISVVISTAPPTIVNAAAYVAGSTSLTGTLSCLGADLNGEVSLKYKWSVVGTQPGKVTYAANNSNAAKTTTVTVATPGVYHLQCVITGLSGATVTSPVTFTAN